MNASSCFTGAMSENGVVRARTRMESGSCISHQLFCLDIFGPIFRKEIGNKILIPGTIFLFSMSRFVMENYKIMV